MPERPPKEWFYSVVKKIERERPEVTDPKALAGWLWYHWMKPKTKKAILNAIKKGRKAKLGIRKITARMLKQYGALDPSVIKVRKGLTKKPKVLGYSDHRTDGLIRVLEREDGTLFPEFAFYPKFDELLVESLKYAGLKEEMPYKWVLRTDKFNIFVYF